MTLAQDIINDSLTALDGFRDDLHGFMTDLQTIADGWTFSPGTAVPTVTITDPTGTISPNFPSAPSLTDPTFGGDGIAVPAVPTAPDIDYSYVDQEFAQAITDSQVAGWVEALTNGTIVDDGSRMFQSGRDRQLLDGQRAQNEFTTSISAKGFQFPGGVVAAGLRRIQHDTNLNINDLNRDLTQKRADMLAQLQDSGTSKAIQFVDLLKRMAAAKNQRLLDAVRVQIDGAKAQMDVQISAISAAVAAIDAYTRKFEAQLSGNNSKADLYRTQVQAEASRLSSLIDFSSLKLKVQTAIADLDIAKANISLGMDNNFANALQASNNSRLNAVSTATTALGTAMAGVSASINGVAQYAEAA